MSKYIDVLLVEDPDGAPHVVTAPSCTGGVGRVVAFNGTMGTVVKRAHMDTEYDEYAILKATVPMHEADAVYIPQYEREKKDAV